MMPYLRNIFISHTQNMIQELSIEIIPLLTTHLTHLFISKFLTNCKPFLPAVWQLLILQLLLFPVNVCGFLNH